MNGPLLGVIAIDSLLCVAAVYLFLQGQVIPAVVCMIAGGALVSMFVVWRQLRGR